MEAVRSRRWYRLHRLTGLAIMVELIAIGCLQVAKQPGGSYGLDSGEREYHVNFGWPVRHLSILEVFPPARSYASSLPRIECVWKAKALFFNCCIFALLTFSVGWLVETWLRRPKHLQFSLRGIFELFAVVAIVLSLVKNPYAFEGGLILMGLSPCTPFQPWFGAPLELNAWGLATNVVISCGTICSIWCLIHLGSDAMGRLLQRVNPPSA
jgi:hypothetical protein